MSLQTQTSTPKLLKASEVAEILNIGRSAAYRLMQIGEMPTVRIGRSVRVLNSDLEDFIAHNRSNGLLDK